MMKKILYSLLLLLAASSFLAQAQGNLQFNRVISESISLNPSQSSTLITVPAGKVWKIEAVEANHSGSTIYKYEINGQVFAISNGSPSRINHGLWLKAGDTFRVLNGPTGNNNTPYYYSILEFNIVP
jgi:hypothetical protein